MCSFVEVATLKIGQKYEKITLSFVIMTSSLPIKYLMISIKKQTYL